MNLFNVYSDVLIIYYDSFLDSTISTLKNFTNSYFFFLSSDFITILFFFNFFELIILSSFSELI